MSYVNTNMKFCDGLCWEENPGQMIIEKFNKRMRQKKGIHVNSQSPYTGGICLTCITVSVLLTNNLSA